MKRKNQPLHLSFDTEEEAIKYLEAHPDYCLIGSPRTRNIDLLLQKQKGIELVTAEELKELLTKNGRFDSWVAIGWNAGDVQKFVALRID